MRQGFINFLKEHGTNGINFDNIKNTRGMRAIWDFPEEFKKNKEEEECKDKSCSFLGVKKSLSEFKDSKPGDIVFSDFDGYFTGVRIEDIPPPQIPTKKLLETPLEDKEFDFRKIMDMYMKLNK